MPNEVEQIEEILNEALVLLPDEQDGKYPILVGVRKAARAIAALQAQDREGAQSVADLLGDAQPTVSRHGDEIVLYCPDGTITNDLYDAIEAAAGRDALPLSPVRTEDEDA